MEQRLDKALLASLDLDAFEKFADPVIGTKIRIDKRPRLFRGHARIARQAEITKPVKQSEVHDLGEAPLVRCNGGLWYGEDFGRRAGVDVLASGECADQHRSVGHVGEGAQLDLRLARR